MLTITKFQTSDFGFNDNLYSALKGRPSWTYSYWLGVKPTHIQMRIWCSFMVDDRHWSMNVGPETERLWKVNLELYFVPLIEVNFRIRIITSSHISTPFNGKKAAAMIISLSVLLFVRNLNFVQIKLFGMYNFEEIFSVTQITKDVRGSLTLEKPILLFWPRHQNKTCRFLKSVDEKRVVSDWSTWDVQRTTCWSDFSIKALVLTAYDVRSFEMYVQGAQFFNILLVLRITLRLLAADFVQISRLRYRDM